MPEPCSLRTSASTRWSRPAWPPTPTGEGPAGKSVMPAATAGSRTRPSTSRTAGGLAVVEILAPLSYELSDYSVASRTSYGSRYEADEAAARLADRSGLQFKGGNSYLD